MKNKLLKLLIASLTGVSTLLCGCNKEEKEKCLNHYDRNSDGLCDFCDYKIPSDKLMSFKGIKFNNAELTYDGYRHAIYVEGVPDFANINYTNNDQTDVGYYKVSALLTAKGYKSLTVYAYLNIVGRDLENVLLPTQTIVYDGEPHSLTVTGAPEDAKIFYTGNDKSEVGRWPVKARIEAFGYKPLELNSYLVITPRKFENIKFESKIIPYDGLEHSLQVEGVPEFATVEYIGNAKKDIGSYSVTAKISAVGYETLTLIATLTIVAA